MAAYQCLNCGRIEDGDEDCCDSPDLFKINDMPGEIKRLRAALAALKPGTAPVTIKENHGVKVAVTVEYDWLPIETCPLGVKVQGKTLPGGVAIYTTLTAATRKEYSHWAPLPRTPKNR